MAKKKKVEKVIVEEVQKIEEPIVEVIIPHVEVVSGEVSTNVSEQEESAVELKSNNTIVIEEDICEENVEESVIVEDIKEEKQNKTHKNNKQPKPIKLDFNFFWNGCSYD